MTEKPTAEFNFTAPTLQPDGSYLLEPTFKVLKKGEQPSDLVIAKNSEIPEQYRLPGETTAQEDENMQYCKMESKAGYFVGRPEEGKMLNAAFYDEKALSEDEITWTYMVRLRELTLTKVGGRDGRSRLETLLAGRLSDRETKVDKRRAYSLGFSMETSRTTIQGASGNSDLVDNPSFIAEVGRLSALVASRILNRAVPQQNIELLELQNTRDCGLNMGHEDNKLITTLQLNYSNTDVASLQDSLGVSGELHIDFWDDYGRWTVLLGLSNIPEGYWPGRTMISSLRLYTVLAPMTALVFKAVQPHLSLGPIKMGEASRAPYQPSIQDVPTLDPGKYVLGRLTAVNYPKDEITHSSTTKLRKTTPEILQDEEHVVTNLADFLPSGIASFGRLRNQFEWKAKSAARNETLLARKNLNYVQPSVDTYIAQNRFLEGGQVCEPRSTVIQAVIDANEKSGENTAEIKKYERYREINRGHLSQTSYGRTKVGKAVWVTELGSSLNNIRVGDREPPRRENKRAANHRIYGSKPYKCPRCDSRYTTPKTCRKQFEDKHNQNKKLQFPNVEPSLDPDKLPGSNLVGSKSSKAGSESRKRKRKAANLSADDEESDKLEDSDTDEDDGWNPEENGSELDLDDKVYDAETLESDSRSQQFTAMTKRKSGRKIVKKVKDDYKELTEADLDFGSEDDEKEHNGAGGTLLEETILEEMDSGEEMEDGHFTEDELDEDERMADAEHVSGPGEVIDLT